MATKYGVYEYLYYCDVATKQTRKFELVIAEFPFLVFAQIYKTFFHKNARVWKR